jgi:Branched-chain amino acid transport protein (AzlD)
MTATELLDPALVAIAVMAAATFVIRAGGFWLMGRVRLTTRVRRILEHRDGGAGTECRHLNRKKGLYVLCVPFPCAKI